MGFEINQYFPSNEKFYVFKENMQKSDIIRKIKFGEIRDL